MATFSPLDPAVRTLWAPGTLYEAGNPRLKRPLASLYTKRATDPKGKQSQEQQKHRQDLYGQRRDLVNVLRATSSRMIWDYSAEAASLSEEEHEYDAEVCNFCTKTA